MRNEQVILITLIPDDTEISEKKITVFAEKKSLVRSEFYAAYQVGMTGKWVFEVNPDDFEMTRYVTEDQTELYAAKLIYGGAVFDIIRTYQTTIGSMEITVK